MIFVDKPIGISPLQTITKLKQQQPELQLETISYAGRLDPMATGLLMLLVNQENQNRKQYEQLTKSYDVEMLVGVSTDTYDVLGLIDEQRHATITKDQLHKTVSSFMGKQNQLYPPYSAARVDGKPLYYWARKGKMNNIIRPTKAIEITKISILSESTLGPRELLQNIEKRINTIEGDFRQAETIALWRKATPQLPGNNQIWKFAVDCSHGTYIRQLVHDIGKTLTIPTLTWSIRRTAVGSFTLKQARTID